MGRVLAALILFAGGDRGGTRHEVAAWATRSCVPPAVA